LYVKCVYTLLCKCLYDNWKTHVVSEQSFAIFLLTDKILIPKALKMTANKLKKLSSWLQISQLRTKIIENHGNQNVLSLCYREVSRSDMWSWQQSVLRHSQRHMYRHRTHVPMSERICAVWNFMCAQLRSVLFCRL